MNSPDCFEEIVHDYYAPLFRFAMSLTKSESDAADLTQQTFFLWATKGHQLRDIGKVKTWLFTALYRSFLMGKRRQSRFANDEFDTESERLEGDAPKSADCTEALAALSRLDEIFRAPLALFYLQDISYAEIAETLQIPIGTVKSRIARGIAQLRELLLSVNTPVATVHAGKTPKSGILINNSVPQRNRPERDLSITHLWEQLAVI